MYIKESTSLIQLTEAIAKLIDRLQSLQKQTDKYEQFEHRLESLLIENETYKKNLLHELIESTKHLQKQNRGSMYWAYAIDSLESRLLHENRQLSGNDGASDRVTIYVVQSRDNEKIYQASAKHRLSKVRCVFKLLKRNMSLQPLLAFIHYVKIHQISVNKVLKRVWSVVRKFLMYGLLDELCQWLKENHGEEVT
ncbi:MAG: hypothetical protein AB8B79_02880 [Granulosicoccus sp.]